MLFKDNPKRNLIITGLVFLIGVIIILVAILPFLNIQNVFLEVLLILIALLIAGYPLIKYFVKNKKDSFEKRNGRKLN